MEEPILILLLKRMSHILLMCLIVVKVSRELATTIECSNIINLCSIKWLNHSLVPRLSPHNDSDFDSLNWAIFNESRVEIVLKGGA